MATITWDAIALKERRKLLEYTYVNFGPLTAKSMSDAIDKIEADLAKHPTTGFIEKLLSTEKEIYRAKLLKRTFKLIYFYDEVEDNVNIIDIWNTRMCPEKLAKRIGRPNGAKEESALRAKE